MEEILERVVSKIKTLLKKAKGHFVDYKQDLEELFVSFETQYKDLYEQKKHAFLEEGLEEREFSYYPPFKKEYDGMVLDYKKLKKEDIDRHQALQKKNVQIRERIISDIQLLITGSAEVKNVLSRFRSLQKEWREASPVPASDRERLSNSFKFQVSSFYDYLDIHKELRDRQFEHNFEEKLHIIKQAEVLLSYENVLNAQKELTELHALWKEIGPVIRCYSDSLWHRFLFVSKKINRNKGQYLKDYRVQLKESLKQKKAIIEELSELVKDVPNNHKEWHKLSDQVENLVVKYRGWLSSRDATFKKVDDGLRQILKGFNKLRNEFYKKSKDEIKVRLDERKSYVEKAHSILKDVKMPLKEKIFQIKKLQKDWGQLKGYLPRKQSQTVWEEFRMVCNKVFDSHREKKKEDQQLQKKTYEKKQTLLKEAIDLKGLSRQEAEQKAVKALQDWQSIGHPNMNLDNTFYQKIESALKENDNFEPSEIEGFAVSKTVENYGSGKDKEDLLKLKRSLEKQLQSVCTEINKLETNKSFFSGNADNNPLLKGLMANLEDLAVKQKRFEQEIKNVNKLINAIKKND